MTLVRFPMRSQSILIALFLILIRIENDNDAGKSGEIIFFFLEFFHAMKSLLNHLIKEISKWLAMAFQQHIYFGSEDLCWKRKKKKKNVDICVWYTVVPCQRVFHVFTRWQFNVSVCGPQPLLREAAFYWNMKLTWQLWML